MAIGFDIPHITAISVASTTVFVVTTNIPESVEAKIESFANLPAGWDYGAGGPLSSRLRATARQWYSFLSNQNFAYIDAFPGHNKITLAAGIGDHYLELIIEESGQDFIYGVAYDFRHKQKFYRIKQSVLGAFEAIKEALGEIWKVSTLSTRESITFRKEDLFATHSQIMADRYPSLKWTASNTIIWAPVNIFGDIMDTWGGSPASPAFWAFDTDRLPAGKRGKVVRCDSHSKNPLQSVRRLWIVNLVGKDHWAWSKRFDTKPWMAGPGIQSPSKMAMRRCRNKALNEFICKHLFPCLSEAKRCAFEIELFRDFTISEQHRCERWLNLCYDKLMVCLGVEVNKQKGANLASP